MAKKLKKHSTRRSTIHHSHAHQTKTSGKPDETYLVIVRSWMLVVVFALMLGIGAIVGTYLRIQLDQTNPTVAGASTTR